ncbi:Siderophore-interacting protein [Salinisphaera dokdonensis CL-ES53]|uniref:Siderophore-interacting protein n=1 Tax=Salinisphaera dokdonensis CL-ES53 TaxID=1304272 RepID=A0ABV2B116_9GAMM
MPRTPPRTLIVLANRALTPHMRRVTLGGDAMADFPADQASAYVKLMLPQPGLDKPVLRTYTVREQRADAIDIDFVVHDHGGPASRWAASARAGDTIDVGGPGPTKRLDSGADWFLLIGDMTALPAISANLEILPASAVGHAIIEVVDRDDIQSLVAPAGIQIDWLINPRPGEDSDALVDAVHALHWREGQPSIWIACEFSAMRRLREHLKTERGVDRRDLYISSYWKQGSNEETHKQEKRADADQAA